jgi:hypothetical protein
MLKLLKTKKGNRIQHWNENEDEHFEHDEAELKDEHEDRIEGNVAETGTKLIWKEVATKPLDNQQCEAAQWMVEREIEPWIGSILALKTGQGKTCKCLFLDTLLKEPFHRCSYQNDDFAYQGA